MSQPLISIDQARRLVLDAVRPLGSESVPIEDALHRVLATGVRAAGDAPPFPCSAMDGYAILAGPAGRVLRIVGESRAGSPSPRPVSEGEAVRISTGAAVPAGATAVIAQEVIELSGATITTTAAVIEGQHIRGAGEDMAAGAEVLAPGLVLGPIELGVAAAAGAGRVGVSRRPRVTVLCTGDELRAPGEPLGPGEIHNSNAPMLTGLAAALGGSPAPAVRLPDDQSATQEGIAAALADSDLVVICGGVSVGPHDHVKPALAELGVREHFWSVALQPGKPTWFGAPDDGPLVFGLPGNPVSAVVAFSLFVAPALAAMTGAPAPRPPRPQARLSVAVTQNSWREQAIRVVLEPSDGELVASPTGAQGSHMLTSLLGADALAMIPAGEGSLEANTIVTLHPLASRS
jgi:molybdopterin molybdotransferase